MPTSMTARSATRLTISALMLALLASYCTAAEQPTLITGAAIALDGAPVEGATVVFTVRETGKADQTITAVSDARGQFKAEITPAFARSVQIDPQPLPTRKLAPSVIFWPRGPGHPAHGEPMGAVTVVYAPGSATLSGTVLGDDQTAIAGATVTVAGGSAGESFTRTAAAGADGKFKLDNLAPGTYRVRSVIPPAGQPFIRIEEFRPYAGKQVNLAEGASENATFTLARGALVSGRVLGEDGKPVAGAAVTCSTDAATEAERKSPRPQAGQWFGGEATTDAGGRYVLSALSPETYYVAVRPPADSPWARTALRGITVPAGGGDIALQDFALPRAGKLIATILGPDGKPIAGANVTGTGLVGKPQEVSDAQGRVAFLSLSTGRLALHVEPPAGLNVAPRAFTDLAVVGGLTVEHALILGDGAKVSGTVTDPDEKPVAGATIYLRAGNFNVGRARSDVAGKFEILGVVSNGMPPGAWMLSVAPPEGERDLLAAQVKIQDPTSGKGIPPLAVKLKAGLSIAGTVTGPDKKPVPGCRVAYGKIDRGAATYGSTTTDAQGQYALSNVQPGTWQVAVLPPDGSGLLGQLTPAKAMTEDEKVEVNVALKAGETVSGKIVNSRGEAPGLVCLVRLEPKSENNLWFMGEAERLVTLSAADGSFKLTGTPRGEHAIKIVPAHPDYLAEPSRTTIPAQDIQVKVVRTGRVSGRVLDPAGKPAAGSGVSVTISQVGGAGGYHNATPDPQGSFVMAGIAPGKYKMVVKIWKTGEQQPQFAPPPAQEIVVAEGQSQTMELTLVPADKP